MAKCAFCGGVLQDTQYKTAKGKRYHHDCYAQMVKQAKADEETLRARYSDVAYQELTRYICELYETSELPPGTERQIEYFRSKGYTYPNIRNALEYFHRIRGNPVKPDTLPLGILPWVYDEAVKYFADIAQVNRQNSGRTLTEVTVSARIKPPSRDLPHINIEDL